MNSHKVLLGLSFSLFTACANLPKGTPEMNPTSPIRAHVLRLKPGQDLLAELKNWARNHHIRAASVVSAVGSLTRVNLRYANQPSSISREGHFEIVSLTGTLNEDSLHLHASVSDSEGVTLGGHLTGENVIYTTLELALAEYPSLDFNREKDSTFGFSELVIRPRP